MAGGRGSANSVAATALVMMVAVTLLVDVAQAASYNVPWTIPFNANWLQGKTFKVGDTLVFKFDKNKHDVMEVTKNGYDTCQPQSTGNGRKAASPATFNLKPGGTHYFICTKPGHCQGGMKTAVTTST
ncbi:early nodulin-like protein 17 [Striga asiatica]|uniref:Early nodulin-like protein 17 n=1 Tax=Striga asiatica TaxID=4170 RepID=A0A5A7NW22_STRAF|nr:early nodulin-like protein 17 [Striga asiatica]